MKLEELTESANQFVYHVTFSKHANSIKKQGLKPLQTSNWAKQDGVRYNEEGGVFAFSHPEDAFKWAFKQKWEFKKPVSIMRLKKNPSWKEDPSDDITLKTGKGKALRSMKAIPANDVLNAFDFDDFKDPKQLKISQADWIKGIIDKLSGNEK